MQLLDTIIAVVLGTGVLVTLSYVFYMLVSIPFSLVYETEKAETKADDVAIVITTIASRNVEESLRNTIEHTVENYGEYPIYCLIDEGSELERELVELPTVETVIVPDEYECRAEAKGRAINYFIETEMDPETWYGFIDDDNLILDDDFLYEIPYYDARGYRATNPILVPRLGGSFITYIADHIRLIDDLTIFRLLTGVIGRPLMGFHGELLCAKGSLFKEITFDRKSIVEDFAFAMECVKAGEKTWQSSTYVSILSPHDIGSFFKQRRRWFTGIAAYIPKSPLPTQLIVGPRVLLWGVALTGNWILLPLWLGTDVIAVPFLVFLLVWVGVVMYVTTGAIGIVRLGLRDSGSPIPIQYFPLIVLIPLASLIEHLSPVYSLVRQNTDFVVIDK